MKIIKTLKKTILIEQESGYRFYVPREIYDKLYEEDKTPPTEDLEALKKDGIPYSLSFDLILHDIFNPEKIQQELYLGNIHTLNDILNNRKRVTDILKKNMNAEMIIQNIKK